MHTSNLVDISTVKVLILLHQVFPRQLEQRLSTLRVMDSGQLRSHLGQQFADCIAEPEKRNRNSVLVTIVCLQSQRLCLVGGLLEQQLQKRRIKLKENLALLRMHYQLHATLTHLLPSPRKKDISHMQHVAVCGLCRHHSGVQRQEGIFDQRRESNPLIHSLRQVQGKEAPSQIPLHYRIVQLVCVGVDEQQVEGVELPEERVDELLIELREVRPPADDLPQREVVHARAELSRVAVVLALLPKTKSDATRLPDLLVDLPLRPQPATVVADQVVNPLVLFHSRLGQLDLEAHH